VIVVFASPYAFANLLDFVGMFRKLKFAGTEIELNERTKSKLLTATTEIQSAIKEYRTRVDREVSRLLSRHQLAARLAKYSDQVILARYGRANVGRGYRCTIHIPDPISDGNLYQLLDYHPEGTGQFRTFSERYGIIGKVWRTEKSLLFNHVDDLPPNAPTEAKLENIMSNWGMNRREAERALSRPARISIRDNAAGIYPSEFPRAFRPAAIPPDRSGLAEFGMGMKSAACWFAPRWTVRTSALGDPVSRHIQFDIDNIVNDELEELVIKEQPEEPEHHFTEVILENVFHIPVGRTIGKIKEHLTDIYRVFVRDGILELRFNGSPLVYEAPNILEAPYYKEKNGASKLWRKSIEFDFGQELSVHGFAALREPASTSRAGFALFRRNRLIKGSGDEGYRPVHVFGHSNSYRYQRLFGELHLEGFEVSHTKDGFRWDENEQPFLELLREHLDSDELPLLRQAEGYRSRAARSQLVAAAQQAVTNTTQAMEARLPDVLPVVADAPPVETSAREAPEQPRLAARRFDIQFRERAWSINVEITNDPAESQWLVLSDSGQQTQGPPRSIDIRVSMAHPFMIRFAQADPEEVEALLRVGAAMAMAEVLARDSGVRAAGTIRRNVNDILREALSEP
jgi:Histidine kinase-, DNA gyrase B-, and HSP90-like ATPase